VFNTKLKPEIRAFLFAGAEKQGIATAAVIEQLVEHWQATSRYT
jgi:hypothetical protein